MSCKQRVWDNGDMTSCDAPTLPGYSYCIPHRVDNLRRLSREVNDCKVKLRDAERRLSELLAEAQGPSAPEPGSDK